MPPSLPNPAQEPDPLSWRDLWEHPHPPPDSRFPTVAQSAPDELESELPSPVERARMLAAWLQAGNPDPGGRYSQQLAVLLERLGVVWDERPAAPAPPHENAQPPRRDPTGPMLPAAKLPGYTPIRRR